MMEKVRTDLKSIEFGHIASLVRDDMLGITKTIPVKKIAKRFGVEPAEIELALEALQYLILHIAKTNAVSIEDFSAIYEQTGLKQDLGV